tara:strand:+ start:208 stop:471 length:264 start_codon:yes stop_codon:yes gene_type:complete
MPQGKGTYGSKVGRPPHKRSSFKMNGWSAFTKTDMPEANMPAVTVTPGMQNKRERYETLNAKLQKQTYLEDAEAREYDALAKELDKQ